MAADDQAIGSPSWRLGAWLGGFGLLLALVAGVSFVSLADGEAGDVASIESSLTDLPANDVFVEEAPADPAGVEQVDIEPRPSWSANESSLLTDLGTVGLRKPVGLRIDALGVSAPIESYGINQRTGQMDVPGNVRDVGWYEHGPSPGQPGSAVLAAHVDLENQGRGVFFDLKSLEPGELIVVGFDDGTEQWFQVEARSTYKKQDLPLDAIFSRQGPSVLTLITCGGGFSASERSYDSNVVVYATPIERSPTTFPLS